MRFFVLLFVCFSFFLVPLQGGEVRVVASIAPVACFAKNVGGERVQVRCLVPQEVSPHDYAMAPSDLREVAKADLAVYVGLGLDDWLLSAVRKGNPKALMCKVSEGIELLDSAAVGEPKRLPAAESKLANPHIWLDPVRAIRMVENLRDAMTGCDPEGAEIYRANASAYIDKLSALDRKISEVAASLSSRNLVTCHDAFPYFAERYGFRVVAVFQEFPGKETTPRSMRALRDKIQKNGVRVIFAEPGGVPRSMSSLAEDMGVTILVLNPLDSGAPTADFYEKKMAENLESLRRALNGH